MIMTNALTCGYNIYIKTSVKPQTMLKYLTKPYALGFISL